jgi:hypothetical protein
VGDKKTPPEDAGRGMMRIERGWEERRAIMEDAKTPEGAEAAEPPESSDAKEMTKAAEPREPSDALKMTKLNEDIGEPRTSQAADSSEGADDQEPGDTAAAAGAGTTAKFPFPLRMTQQAWLIVATVFLGVITLLIFGRATGKNNATGEGGQERTVDSLTPESLVAKCGPPAEDVTKDLYPMIKRTMSYKSSGKGTLAFEFSRTAEEKSAWVFLSMSDENGATYGTPETQIAAMPCLSSKK